MLNLLGFNVDNFNPQQTVATKATLNTQMGILQDAANKTPGQLHVAHLILDSVANPTKRMVMHAEVMMLVCLAAAVLLVTCVKGYSLAMRPNKTG